MTEFVLDASVVLKWFAGERERRGSGPAKRLRRRYLAGEVLIIAPSLLYLEILNVAGRRWSLPETDLADLATGLSDLGFESAEPTLDSVASWVSAGLTAYDAAYVALASERGCSLVTGDREILRTAPQIAVRLTR